jgi:hypothetical protein
MSLLLLLRPSTGSGASPLIVTGRFDRPSPSGNSGEGSPIAGGFDRHRSSLSGNSGEGSPAAGEFDPPSPGVTNA